MKQALVAFLSLAAAWLLLSGHYTPLLLAFGVGSCLLVLALSLRMGVVDRESQPYHLTLRTLIYLPWLLGQIVKANLAVARLVLGPKSEFRPRLVRVRSSQKTSLGQVIHANSITLTPGTLSLDVRDGVILVHAIDEEAEADVTSGEMDRRVSRLEGES